MPKYSLLEEDIEWCESHRNPSQEAYQDGFIAGLRHALFLMKSRPTKRAMDEAKVICNCSGGRGDKVSFHADWCKTLRS